jgi:predicted RNA-binding Zn-ribbon protein involved in translation (DUF1610 family)
MTVSHITFPCASCGGPVEPLPGKTHLPCPYCGSLVVIPENLRIAAQPADTPRSTATKYPFIAPPPPANDDITDVLRQVQPLATGAVKAYGLWMWLRILLRRVVPACAIVLIFLCLITCGIGAIILFLGQRGG